MGKPGRAARAAGWVAVGAIAAGGVATAATTTGGNSKSSSATTSSSVSSVVPAATTPTAAPNPRAGWGRRLGRLAKLGGRVLHGEFTVEGKGGTPTEVAEQRGTVNAVSTTSITLTSKDGYSHSYVVDPSTRVRVDGEKGSITGVKTGQDAIVLAKVNGSTETAAIVIQRAAK